MKKIRQRFSTCLKVNKIKMKKFAPTFDLRNLKSGKQSLTAMATPYHDTIYNRAATKALIPFLEEIYYRYTIKHKFLNLHKRVVFIQ